MEDPLKVPEPEEPFVDSQGKTRSKSYLEKQKLDLEIQNLRKKGKWESLLAFVPLFTVVLSLAGLGVGLWQFQRQQDKWLQEQDDERAAKEQERIAKQHERTAEYLKQLRGDVDEISKFAEDKGPQNISRVSFLLDDMSILIDLSSKDSASAETIKRYESTVTKALVDQIVIDGDFENSSKDLIFAEKIVRNWVGYQEYLKKDGQVALKRILSNYSKAMGSFRNKNLSYVNNVFYNPTAQRFNTPGGSGSKLFQDLSYILRGFKEHLNLWTGPVEEKKQFITEFQAELCNDSLAQATLKDGDFIQDVACKKR